MAESDTAVVRIPGLTIGGALQISNASLITALLAGLGISIAAMGFMRGGHREKFNRRERFRRNPRAIGHKVFRDVVSFAADSNSVVNNLGRVQGTVHKLMNTKIKDMVDAYRRGEITAQQFDASVRNLYQIVLDELQIAPNTVPIHVTNQLNAKVDRIADKILEGQLPVKVKFRMYKEHPGLAELHELGRQRALEVGKGHKYGLKRVMGLHTSSGVYLKPVGWNRPGYKGKGHHYAYGRLGLRPETESGYGAWFRP